MKLVSIEKSDILLLEVIGRYSKLDEKFSVIENSPLKNRQILSNNEWSIYIEKLR